VRNWVLSSLKTRAILNCLSSFPFVTYGTSLIRNSKLPRTIFHVLLRKKKKKKSLLCLPTYRVEVRNWNRLKGLTIDGTGSMDLDRSGASIWDLGGWRKIKKIKNKK
jgi:hypothetical protein